MAPIPAPKLDLDKLLAATSDLVLVTDAYGLFLRVSKSSKEIIGYEGTYLEGRLAVDFIYPPDLENVREEMRRARRTRRSRIFVCRYVGPTGQTVELIWKGDWLAEQKAFLFVGRRPVKSEFSILVRRLDVLDGFQLCKGLFAGSLVLAFLVGIGGNATAEVRRIIGDLGLGDSYAWITFMVLYAVACITCLVWKHRWFQFGVSVVSVFAWVWMGFVTLWAPNYSAAAGLYEVMLGLGSILVLYFRGRKL